MKALLIRYALPAVSVFILTWFGKSYISNILAKAEGYDDAVKQVEIEVVKRKTQVSELENSLAEAAKTAEKADQRREHWRQSYYKVKNDYDEHVKKWGAGKYPDDID